MIRSVTFNRLASITNRQPNFQSDRCPSMIHQRRPYYVLNRSHQTDSSNERSRSPRGDHVTSIGRYSFWREKSPPTPPSNQSTSSISLLLFFLSLERVFFTPRCRSGAMAWMVERAEEELRALEAQHPHRLGPIKLELMNFIADSSPYISPIPISTQGNATQYSLSLSHFLRASNAIFLERETERGIYTEGNDQIRNTLFLSLTFCVGKYCLFF